MNGITHKLSRLTLVFMMIGLLLGMASCDSVIYDNEGDCDVTYRLVFRYDMNLKWADAFANEVKSVHLYAYDTDGHLVWETTDKGEHLASPGYSIMLNLPPGTYKLIAWCGTDNDAHLDPERDESFTVAPAAVGSHHDDLLCSLNRMADDEHPAYSDQRLYSLFHGSIEVTLPDSQDGEDYVYTMPLTKDTNHVRIILQHLSGEDVDAGDFTFHIEDANGLLGHDNSLLQDEEIRYRPWAQTTATAGVGKPDLANSRGIVQVRGAIADMTVNRLSPAHKKSMMLTIKNKSGETVAHVPVIDYALLAKSYYEEAYGHKMSEQEFLDREDEYTLTFFLDENNKWISSQILIHSWVVVLQNHDI
ncbi:MAG: FimB/Mfa2 family fimbrial subunit [Muribaculaceae bacterium]|nr:FimB/Mfa2 family fimbrial subunit [Muribaculaceae bacterium]